MRVLALAALVLLAGCDETAEENWARFNSDDQVEVAVTAGTSLGDPVSVDLTSTTGSVLLGTASVNPGSGPVGTDHTVTVQIDDEWEDTVGRASVQTDAGDRGVEEHELQRDSADHGLWIRDLTSVGTEGEERTDVFTIQLWVSDGDTGV